MSDHDPTERALRAALASSVPADLDATDFRRRLDAMLVADASGADVDRADVNGVDVSGGGAGADAIGARAAGVDGNAPSILSVDLGAAHGVGAGTRRARRRTTLVVSVLALAAAVAAVLAVVLPGGNAPHDATDGTYRPAPLLRAMRTAFFPGTRTVTVVDGHGSAEVRYPVVAVPRHYSYAVYSTCWGGGTFGVDGATTPRSGSRSGCTGSPASMSGASMSGASVSGTTFDAANGRVGVVASRRTRWQVAVVLAPQIRTNAVLSAPADSQLTGPDTPFVRSGSGTAAVSFPGVSGSRHHHYTVTLVCHGSGVRLPGATLADGSVVYTHTCFAGEQYTWSLVTLDVSRPVRVVAAAGTTWTVELSRE